MCIEMRRAAPPEHSGRRGHAPGLREALPIRFNLEVGDDAHAKRLSVRLARFMHALAGVAHVPPGHEDVGCLEPAHPPVEVVVAPLSRADRLGPAARVAQRLLAEGRSGGRGAGGTCGVTEPPKVPSSPAAAIIDSAVVAATASALAAAAASATVAEVAALLLPSDEKYASTVNPTAV